GRELLFHLMDTTRSGRIVKDRDAGKFGNGFLEQLKALAAQCWTKVGNAGHISAWTCEAFNETCLDRIEPSTRHYDGNSFGRILGRPNQRFPSCYDDINLETYQFGRKLREPILLPLRISVLEGDVLSFYVAKLAQSQPNRLGTGRFSSRVSPR